MAKRSDRLRYLGSIHMKQCRKCGDNIPSRMLIDGVYRNTQRRLYCLVCSPFGAHNTKKLSDADCNRPALTTETATTVTCTCACGRNYLYDRRKGHTKQKCNSCNVNQRRFSIKERCLAYKGGKCERCGYSRCARALVFHHNDPKEKEWGIGGNHSRKWSDIVRELDKCQLLCANCHMEVHSEMDA